MDQWGTLTPCVGIHTVGADNNSVRAHHSRVQHKAQCIPRLPSGVSYLFQSHHAPSIEMSSYITLLAALDCIYTNKSSQGKMLPQESTVACSPKSPTQKQVWFNLPSKDDLGNSLQLSTNLAGFLKHPEGATDEQCDTWCSPTLVATCSLVWPKMAIPGRESNQQHSTTSRGATPRSGTTHPLALQPWGTLPYMTQSRPNQTAQGVGQGICWGDEDATQLVARVPDSEPGVIKRGCTAAGQETGCRFLILHSSIQRNGLVGSSSQPP